MKSSNVIINTFFAFFNAATRWMDGSAILSGLSAFLDFLKRVAMSSFIIGLFIGDESPSEEIATHSVILKPIHKILNGLPKPIQSVQTFPSKLSHLMAGSWLIHYLCKALDLGIPAPKTLGRRAAANNILQYILYAAPILGMAVIVLALPFLPTMILAAALIPVYVLILLSRKFVIDKTAVFLLLFIIISLIAALLSLEPRSSINIALLSVIFIFSMLAITATVKTENNIEFFLMTFIFSAALTGLFGIFQMLTAGRADTWLDREIHTDIGARIGSTFSNPNVYGTYLLLAIPVAAAGIIYFKGWFLKICSAGATALLLICLLLTYSRGCYLALAIGVAAFAFIMSKRMIILAIPVVIALPFILPLILPATVLNRLLSVVNMADTSTIFRLAIWQGSIRILQDFWLSGVGQGLAAFNRVYPYYALAAAGTQHAHNLFLVIFIETGITGFLVFLGCIVCFFRTHINFVKNTNSIKYKTMSAAMMAAMIAFLFQSIFDHTFFNYRVMLMFFLFMGMSIAFTRIYWTEKKMVKEAALKTLVSGYYDEH